MLQKFKSPNCLTPWQVEQKILYLEVQTEIQGCLPGSAEEHITGDI